MHRLATPLPRFPRKLLASHYFISKTSDNATTGIRQGRFLSSLVSCPPALPTSPHLARPPTPTWKLSSGGRDLVPITPRRVASSCPSFYPQRRVSPTHANNILLSLGIFPFPDGPTSIGLTRTLCCLNPPNLLANHLDVLGPK